MILTAVQVSGMKERLPGRFFAGLAKIGDEWYNVKIYEYALR